MAPVGPLDNGLIKRDICMGGQYINMAAFRVSIQYDPMLWVLETHEKEQNVDTMTLRGPGATWL